MSTVVSNRTQMRNQWDYAPQHDWSSKQSDKEYLERRCWLPGQRQSELSKDSGLEEELERQLHSNEYVSVCGVVVDTYGNGAETGNVGLNARYVES